MHGGSNPFQGIPICFAHEWQSTTRWRMTVEESTPFSLSSSQTERNTCDTMPRSTTSHATQMHVLTVRPRFGCKKDADVNIGIYEDCKLEDLLRSLELVRGTKRTHRVKKEMLTQAQTNEKALKLDPGDSANLAVYKDGLLCAFSTNLFVAAAKDEEILQIDTLKGEMCADVMLSSHAKHMLAALTMYPAPITATPKKRSDHSTTIALFLLSLCTGFAIYHPRSTKELLLGLVAVGICLYTATHMLMPLPKVPKRKLSYQPYVKVEPVPETPKAKDTRSKAAFYSAAFTVAGIGLLKIEGSFAYLSKIGAVISFVQASILGYPVIAIVYKALLMLFGKFAPRQVAAKLDQLSASVKL